MTLLAMTDSVSKQGATVPGQVPAQPHFSLVRFLFVKSVGMTVITLVLVLLQAWAAPRFYRIDRTAGFYTGILEGALMPAALPGLLAGHDLPIYAPNNSGRGYNIGYIFGINVSGMFFFGVAFWRPQGVKFKR